MPLVIPKIYFLHWFILKKEEIIINLNPTYHIFYNSCYNILKPKEIFIYDDI